jgi:hypothetical protein
MSELNGTVRNTLIKFVDTLTPERQQKYDIFIQLIRYIDGHRTLSVEEVDTLQSILP